MSSFQRNDLKGMALAVTGFSLFACGDAFFKGLSGHYNPITILFYNTFFSLLVFLAFARPMGGLRATLRSKALKIQLLRGLTVCAQVLLMIYSFTYTSLAKTYALIFITPFVTTILALLIFREPVGARKWFCIAAGFCGVLVILRPGLIPLDLPALAALGSAIFFACTYLLAKKAGTYDDTLLSFALPPIFTIVVCLLPVYLQNPEVPTQGHLPLLAASALFSSAGFTCVSLGFVYASAALAAPFQYIQIIWAIIFGYLFFNDTLDPWTGAGITIIVLSGLWLIRISSREFTKAPLQER